MKAKKVNQVKEIAKLFGGFASSETNAESVAISWSRWDAKLCRLNELSCNDSRLAQKADAKIERLRKDLPRRFSKLFMHCHKFEECFFVNRDPRGHALKIDRKKACEKKAFFGITDWGGDIILSPEC